VLSKQSAVSGSAATGDNYVPIYSLIKERRENRLANGYTTTKDE
jgi:hypothetical protein